MSKTVNLALQRAIRERDNFLEQHPELKEFQSELEAQFQAMGNNDPFINMQIIRHHMQWNLNKLQRIRDEIEAKTTKLH